MKKIYFFLFSLLPIFVNAQFANDSTNNVVIQDAVGSGQETPLISSRADGGAYISWFDQSTGMYVLRMQRLDALGNKLWGPNGVVVSNANQNTALFRYDLKTDNEGNAIVAFQDQRTGNMQVVAQKMDSTGIPVWATNGVVLSDADAAQGLAPVIGVLSNNNVVVAWNAYSSTNQKWVCYIELNPATGASINGAGPEKIKPATGTTPNYSRPSIASYSNNEYYLMYVQETGNFPGLTSKLYAKRMATNYVSLWTLPVQFTTKTITAFFFPHIISDGATGFLCAFNTGNPSNAALTSVYLQHVDSSGTTWSTTGTALTSSTGINSYLGDYFYDPTTNQTWVALQVTNTGQSASGNSIQRVSNTGANLCGTDGIVVDAQTSNMTIPVGIAQDDNNAMLVYYTGGFNQVSIKATLIDSMGVKQWAFNEKAINVTASNKDDIGITRVSNHQLIITWTDTRNDYGIYAQNINDDGTLGPMAVGLNNLKDNSGIEIIQNPSSILYLRSKSSIEEIEIYNAMGQMVYSKLGLDNTELSIPLTNVFTAGNYIIRVNRKTTLRWIKQ
ncbi:MAG: T9SS type A sorting domain-containing protein [Bacteroidota bacterium]